MKVETHENIGRTGLYFTYQQRHFSAVPGGVLCSWCSAPAASWDGLRSCPLDAAPWTGLFKSWPVNSWDFPGYGCVIPSLFHDRCCIIWHRAHVLCGTERSELVGKA